MADYFCLIKFGQKEHLVNLMERGQMRFGALSAFELSTEEERGDKFEGAINIVNGQFTKIECDHPTLGKYTFTPVPNSMGRLMQFAPDTFFCFSSYAITPKCFHETDLHKISEKMLAFGDYALVITEPILFFDKVKHILTQMNLDFAFSLVDYENFEAEGDFNTSLLSKTDTLSHQYEHRILVKNNIAESGFFIEVGSLKDFSFLSSAKDIIDTKFEANRRQPA